MKCLFACGAVAMAMAVLSGCSRGNPLDNCSAALVVVENRTGAELEVQVDNRPSNTLQPSQGQCIDVAETGAHEIAFSLAGEEEVVRQIDLGQGEVLTLIVTIQEEELDFTETMGSCTAGQANTSCLVDPG